MLDEIARTCAQVVPEIAAGVVQMVAIARMPGTCAMVAVRSYDEAVDPVAAVVAHLVQLSELIDEQIIVAPWDADPATFACNALGAFPIQHVIIDRERHRLEMFVPDAELVDAIARWPDAIQLAADLTGWQLDVHKLSKYRSTT